MKNETCVVFSAIHPLTQKEIPISEKKKYLSCKFWKETKEEADLFYTFYRGEIWSEVHRITGILSGEFFNPKNFDVVCNNLSKAFDLYYFAFNSPPIIEFPELKIIIDAIKGSATYPKEYLLDDVLVWACENELINAERRVQIEKCILTSRGEVFSVPDPTDEQKIQAIKLFTSEHKCIFYPDAKELLFPDLDLLLEVQAALEANEIHGFNSKDKEILYLDMRSLIKWLMRGGYLLERYIAEFLSLKLESIKENKIEYQGKFDSLHKHIQLGKDRNELLNAGKNGVLRIYLKYPRKYLQWREGPGQVTANQPHLPQQRYDGFGQLKRKITEDRHFGQFGGLTVDMLFFNELPVHGLARLIPGSEHEIEFVPTKEEAEYGLQPYIKFPADEMLSIITDENLIFLHEAEDAADNYWLSNKPVVPLGSTVQPSSQDQLLTKASIVNSYSGGAKKLSATKWKYIFDNENKNGLSVARKGKERNKAVYSLNILHSWLLKEGYFTQKELNRIANPDNKHDKFGREMFGLANGD